MPRKILIVDDNIINRQMLGSVLQKEYSIMEAANGEEALALMHRHYKILSAVLLDIVMPGIDGYEVLRRARENPLLFQIPIIMVTGSEDEAARVKALSLGANDYILKPFNPDIVRHCLRNNIALRETASILNAIQKDKLTGLYNREAFFEKTGAIIKDSEPGTYILAGFDIDNFKLVNDQYGAAEGDRILREIGAAVKTSMDEVGGIAARIAADNFAALIPAEKKDETVVRQVREKNFFTLEGRSVTFSLGCYLITDLSLPVSAIYDRAYLAKQSVKGRYDTHLAYFDETMLEKLVRDQQIVGDMEAALTEHQFEVWFQPQYNCVTGALTGAEALVRWRHPQKGMISPGVFIPLFEQNGFVYELDKYVWRETCRYLRKWIDEGRAPLPVSVNISRCDIFRTDLIEVITGLVREFDIPISMLRLEITESAFATSTAQICEIVGHLTELGFTMEIDDFGSGYSSLNTLKSVPAQVVKLDMRFLGEEDGSRRGGNILESVVRMVKWLGMSVIAEGVETKEQSDFLKSIGCSHVQGYLFARPMPAADYEKHCKGAKKELYEPGLETAESYDNMAFWNPNSMDSLIFSSYVGAACIYEYTDGKIEMVRATDAYARMFGEQMTVDDLLKLDLSQYLDPFSAAETLRKVDIAIKEQHEAVGEFVFRGLPDAAGEITIRSTMRVVANIENRYLIYCISENVTVERHIAQTLLDNLPCGAGICEIADGDARMTYLNKRYRSYFQHYTGLDRGVSVFGVIHPDDLPKLRLAMRPAMEEGGEGTCVVRILDGEGEYLPFRLSGVSMGAEGNHGAIYVTFVPISHEELSFDEMLTVALEKVMESSRDLSFVKDKDLRYICCSRAFATMVGLKSEKEIVGKTDADLFEEALAARYTADDRALMADGKSIIDKTESIPAVEGREHYSSTSKYLLHNTHGAVIGIYGVGRDITHTREAASRQDFLINNIPGGVAVYEGKWSCLENIRIVYFSDGFCRLFGYTREEYEALVKTSSTSLVTGEFVSGLTAQITALVHSGTPIDYIYKARVKDGGFRWIQVKAVPGERHGENMTVNAVFFDVTEHQEALEQLRVSEEENRLAIRHSGNVVCRYDVAKKTLRVSSGVSPIFAVPSMTENVPEGPVRDGIVSPDTADAYIRFYEGIRKGDKSGTLVYQRMSKLGWRWIEASSSTIFGSGGSPVSAVISMRDVTESFEKDVAYKMWIQSLRNKNPESYALLRCNVSKKTVLDMAEGSLLRAPLRSDQFGFDEQTESYAAQYVLDEDKDAFRAFLNVDALMENNVRDNHVLTLEYREKQAGATFRWLRLTVDLVEYPHSGDVEAYMLFEDIDEQKRAELLTIERAETDPLTGLYNRTTFAERADALITGGPKDNRYALLMLDIDGFKLVNDVFGHSAGDQTLIELAGLLRKITRRDDLVGRLGGDEFVVFMNDIPDDRIVAKKAKQINELARKAFSADVQISASVGIALYPENGANFEKLYGRADEALYHVKGMGKDNFAFYQEGMRVERLPASDAETPAVVPIGERKRRMLIVDDNRIDYEMLANLFCDEYIIEKAKDGNAALIRLRHYGSAISVVLLDLMMPGMDGFAVLEKMRQSPEMRLVPVVVVSGVDDRETSLRAIRAGASDFVMKPVDADVLRIRVRSAISKSENERLRAKNSFLELQTDEATRYKAVLDRIGLAVIELDWGKGVFTYSRSVTSMLTGKYDGRPLWRILLSDMVTDAQTVRALQELTHEIAVDRGRAEGEGEFNFRVPSGAKHRFAVHIYKQADEFGLADKIILTLHDKDTDYPPPA